MEEPEQDQRTQNKVKYDAQGDMHVLAPQYDDPGSCNQNSKVLHLATNTGGGSNSDLGLIDEGMLSIQFYIKTKNVGLIFNF